MNDPALDLRNHMVILNQVMMLREALHLLSEVTDWSIAAQSVGLEGDLNVAVGMLQVQTRMSVEVREDNLQELEAEATASPLLIHPVEPELDSSIDSS